MSVAMTNCGLAGWVSDRTGYRYDPIDPLTGRAWPAMPESFLALAREAAARLGFEPYDPDVCLINRYEPGARLSLHQDRDEKGYVDPIVSVSLGLPAVFLFGGARRADRAARIPLMHADVVVWGGPSRLRFHGVMPLKEGHHPLLGRKRINLTFRKALSRAPEPLTPIADRHHARLRRSQPARVWFHVQGDSSWQIARAHHNACFRHPAARAAGFSGARRSSLQGRRPHSCRGSLRHRASPPATPRRRVVPRCPRR